VVGVSAVPTCLCGCLKTFHKAGKKACGRCGVCDEFELDESAPAAGPDELMLLSRLRETTAPPPASAHAVPLGESTSARLRRVEDDRDRDLATLRAEIAERAQAGLLLEAELSTARAELDRLRAALAEAHNQKAAVGGERDRAREQVRVLEHAATVAGPVLTQHTRYLCETCGARYSKNYTDHEHGELTSVTVTVARGAYFPATTTNTQQAATS
jgi:hypothetical protein